MSRIAGNGTLYARIEPRKPRVNITLKHEPPALVNELYGLQLVVESLEDTPLKDIRYAFSMCFYLSVKQEREPVPSSPPVYF